MTSARSRRPKKHTFGCSSSGNKPMKSEFPKKKLCVGVVSVLSISLIVLGFLTYSSNSSLATVNIPRSLIVEQRAHQSQVLSRRDTIVVQGQVTQTRLWNFVTSILIPRPPGSRNIAIVKEFINRIFQDLPGWQVNFDTFNDNAPQPYGQIEFSNIIASTNPNARRKLILACHYDSKIFPGQVFLGATDSAAPCAMLLEIASALNVFLLDHTEKQISNHRDKLDVALELIFFDGEEAFVRWTARDSIYGARHLAREWKKLNKLKDIDLFVLLDLIGHSETNFVKFLRPSTTWFDVASSIEDRITRLGFLPEQAARVFLRPNETNRYHARQQIQDDHLPFMNEGVPVMHLIPVPFPRVWHTVDDNADALDLRRMQTITQILVQFVAEYLHLRVPPK